MAKERRSAKRKRFVYKYGGKFYLAVNGNHHEVKDIVDASGTGIGLEVGIFLDPGRIVWVIYENDGALISTSGTITRCEKTSRGAYRVGVVYDYPNREESNLFFKTVKKILETDEKYSYSA